MPRSVYLHVPFCARHCGYCNFTVIAGRSDLTGDFLRGIELEMGRAAAGAGSGPPLETLYLGGGTPTQLSSGELRRLFDIVHRRFTLEVNCEITVEANPADVDAAKMKALAELGINRLSLGAQSFRDEKLAALERDHRREDILRAVSLAREHGVWSLSLDLIFAAPGETLEGWRRELDEALALAPEHISTYGLTFEKGTTFYGRLRRGELRQLDEETEAAMYVAAIDALTAAGFEHYEVSNFARPGHRSRHNEVYWTGKPYLAFGPGASRFVGGRRETNHRSVTRWLARVLAGQSPVAESEMLAPEDAARERLVFGLRRLEGVSLKDFASETGFSAEALGGPALDRFIKLGLLETAGGQLRLTRSGLLVSDSLWPELL